MNNCSLRTVGLTLALALIGANLSGCGGADSQAHAKTDAPREVLPVEVATAVVGTLEPSYQSTSVLQAEREAKLVAERAGEVVSLLVEEGDHVSKGQVLARLDPDRARLALKQASAVRNRLQHEVQRNEQLIERHIISRDAYDKTRFDRDMQQASVAIAELDLSKTEIRAPFAGVITHRHVKQGQWLAAQAVAFQIADFSELKTRIDVPERAAQVLKPGQDVVLSADAFVGMPIKGVVERVSPIVDRESGTVVTTIAINNPNQALRPGVFVRASVNYQRIEAAVLIPRQAIIKREGQSTVFTVHDGKAKEQVITLGVENGSVVQVIAGIAAGTSVVVVGQNALYNDVAVQVINAPPATADSRTARL